MLDSYVDDGKESPSDADKQKSKEFWLELANQRLAGLRGGGQDADEPQQTAESYTIDGMPTRQPGEPFSEVEAKLQVSAARERLEESGVFREIDSRTQRTLRRILAAFREARVGPHLFGGTDGYGHGDLGRETLDEIYAKLFGAEAALIRIQCFSGTHAIACALFAVLRPGDEMLAISGKPYDTLEEVIGTRKEDPDLVPMGMTGSLDDFGVTYKEIDLFEDGSFDLKRIGEALDNPKTRLIHIQRSALSLSLLPPPLPIPLLLLLLALALLPSPSLPLSLLARLPPLRPSLPAPPLSVPFLHVGVDIDVCLFVRARERACVCGGGMHDEVTSCKQVVRVSVAALDSRAQDRGGDRLHQREARRRRRLCRQLLRRVCRGPGADACRR